MIVICCCFLNQYSPFDLPAKLHKAYAACLRNFCSLSLTISTNPRIPLNFKISTIQLTRSRSVSVASVWVLFVVIVKQYNSGRFAIERSPVSSIEHSSNFFMDPPFLPPTWSFKIQKKNSWLFAFFFCIATINTNFLFIVPIDAILSS